MVEQRNRASTAVHAFLEDPDCNPNSLSKKALRPLLELSERVLFSTGISKGSSKAGSATRFSAARLPDETDSEAGGLEA